VRVESPKRSVPSESREWSESRRGESNPWPTHYECVALPLSYSGGRLNGKGRGDAEPDEQIDARTRERVGPGVGRRSFVLASHAEAAVPWDEESSLGAETCKEIGQNQLASEIGLDVDDGIEDLLSRRHRLAGAHIGE
jgi:hypothetical protein